MKEEYPYLNDEELKRLIAQVEETEMLAAPVYLKQEVLLKVEAVEAERAVKKINTVPAGGTSSRRLQLFVYSAKVAVAATAAMLCLTLLPMGMDRAGAGTDLSDREKRIEQDMAKYEEQNTADTGVEEKKRNDIAVIMNEKTDELCWKLHQFSNLFIMEERDYD